MFIYLPRRNNKLCRLWTEIRRDMNLNLDKIKQDKQYNAWRNLQGKQIVYGLTATINCYCLHCKFF